MNIELTMIEAEDEELFRHLKQAKLTDSDAFRVDIGDKEYLALPLEVTTTANKIRTKIQLIEADVL